MTKRWKIGTVILAAAGCILLTWSVQTVQAGLLDDLKKKATEAIEQKTGPGGGSDSGPGQSGQGSAPAPASTEGRGKPTPHPSGYPPGLMFSTVLNGVKIHSESGLVYLDHIQAVFLPTPPVKSRTIYPYDPRGGGLIWAVIKDASGRQLVRFDMTGENIKEPYWLLDTALCQGCSEGNLGIKLAPGNYNLDFYVEGDHFYHFPFAVGVIKARDAFSSGDFYCLEGDWSDWGYLYYTDADPSKPLLWKVWLRHKIAENRGKDAKIKIEILRGGQVICTNRPDTTYNLKPWWIRFEFDMIFPMKGTSGGAYFKAQDLVGKDGQYTLKMAVDDQPYGTWSFAVQGGKLNYTGRTVRGQADRLTFVEGGRDAWWYKK